MGTHNDFRSSAETQVKSPQHNMYRKRNDPLNWGLTEAVPPNP